MTANLVLLALVASPPLVGIESLRWDPGAEECTPADARIEARALDEHTVAIRQNPCVDAEANVIYLLKGTSRALLIDSGATEDPQLNQVLVDLVSTYLAAPDGSRLPLTVAHTHGHQDHRLGDAAFAKLPDTRIAPHEGAEMRRFFGLDRWPDGKGSIDLGGRVVEIIPAPGHHADHVVFYDERTQALFSGDFLLPGRLLVEDLDAYRESAARLAQYATFHPIEYVLGAHVELGKDGRPYPAGATFHPDERPLVLGFLDLRALPQALEDFNGFYSSHANFIVVNPVHNLVALATGLVVALALLVWGIRGLLRRPGPGCSPASRPRSPSRRGSARSR